MSNNNLNGIYKIPLAKHVFIMGKCVYSEQGHYYTEEDDKNALSELSNILKEYSVYLYAADTLLPYLADDEQKDIINDNRIGKIIKVTKDHITISTNDKYGGYKLIKRYYKNDSSVMEADYNLMGNINDDLRLEHPFIARFNLFINPEVMYNRNGKVSQDDILRFKIPLFLKADDKGEYRSPEWDPSMYYTRECIDKVISSNDFKRRLKDGSIPLVMSLQFSPTGEPIIDPRMIAGSIVDIDLDENYIELVTSKFNYHSQVFINHADLLGKEIYAMAAYVFNGNKNTLVDANGRPLGSTELDIKDILCYVIKRYRPKPV